MGYSYDSSGRLCCDHCGKAGGVLKHRCPFGYCQSTALCPSCWEEIYRATWRQKHLQAGCKEEHEKFDAYNTEKENRMKAGEYLRCSALSHGERIKVIFRRFSEEVAYWMSSETYDAFPLLANVSPDDFRKHGILEPCKTANIYDAEFRIGDRVKDDIGKIGIVTRDSSFDGDTDKIYVQFDCDEAILVHISRLERI